jgi:uncharacterized protein YggE
MAQDNQSVLTNKQVRLSVVVALVLLSVFLLSKTLTELFTLPNAVDPFRNNTISVNGTGEITATPDIAQFSFSVIEDANDVATAQQTVAKKMQAVYDALTKLGVDKKDIKTESFDVQPKYVYPQTQVCTRTICPPVYTSPTIDGYTVSEMVSVKVRNIEKAGDVLTAVGTLQVKNVSGLQFVVDDVNALKQQALISAIANAKTNAEQIAASLGTHVVRITGYYETGDNGGAPIFASAPMTMSAKSDVAVPQVISTGESKITSNVSVSFEIK